MKHGTVRSAASAKMVPLMESRKPSPLRNAHDVYKVVDRENIHQYFVPDFYVAAVLRQAHLAKEAHWVRVRLLEVSLQGLLHSPGRRNFHQPQLRGLITVRLRCLALHHNARARFQHGHWNHIAVFCENLRHAEFLAEYGFYHVHHWLVVRGPWSVVRCNVNPATDNGRLTTDIFTSCVPSQTP